MNRPSFQLYIKKINKSKIISRGLSYLVTNSETEIAKFLKAQQLAVKIVNEAEFIDLIKVKQTNISDF